MSWHINGKRKYRFRLTYNSWPFTWLKEKLVWYLEDKVKTLFDSYQKVILLFGLCLRYLMHYANVNLSFYIQLIVGGKWIYRNSR